MDVEVPFSLPLYRFVQAPGIIVAVVAVVAVLTAEAIPKTTIDDDADWSALNVAASFSLPLFGAL